MPKPLSRSSSRTAEKPRADDAGPAGELFAGYPARVKAKLLALRRLIFDTAKATKGVGALEETLKWGQPSYLTTETGSGSTIRIDQVKPATDQYAVYFRLPNERADSQSAHKYLPARDAVIARLRPDAICPSANW